MKQDTYNNKDNYKQNNVAEAGNLLESTKNKIYYFMEPTRYRHLLSVFGKFYRYSYVNVMLIALQQPDATYIAGFETWKNYSHEIWNDPARQILKAEAKGNGIRLLAPYTVVNQAQRNLINYIVNTFDISQTNSIPPLEQDPEYICEPKVKRLISALRTHSPYTVMYAGRENLLIEQGMNGYCDHEKKFLFVKETLPPKKFLSTLCKEIATAELYKLKYSDKELLEFITESIIYIYNCRFGRCIESEMSSFSFVSRLSDVSIDRLDAAMFAIQRVAYKLISATEPLLEEFNEYESFSWSNEEGDIPLDWAEVFLSDSI